MKLQGKAYVEEHEFGKGVRIAGEDGTSMPIKYFPKQEQLYNDGSAQNLCDSLNAWRESYALKAIEETVNEMEHLND